MDSYAFRRGSTIALFSTAGAICLCLLLVPGRARAQQTIDLTLGAPTHTYLANDPVNGTVAYDTWQVTSTDAPSTPRVDFSAGGTVVNLNFPQGVAIPSGLLVTAHCQWISAAICNNNYSGTVMASAANDPGGFTFGPTGIAIGDDCTYTPDIDFQFDVSGTTTSSVQMSGIQLAISTNLTSGQSGTFGLCYVSVGETLSTGAPDPGPLWTPTCGDGVLFPATEQCDGEPCCTAQCKWDTACLADAGVGDAGALDAGSADAGSADAGTLDAGSADAGTLDAGSADAGTLDAGSADAGTLDAGSADAGTLDAGSADAGALDAGTADAGTLDAGGGNADAGAGDGGTMGGTPSSGGCSCSVIRANDTVPGAIAPLALLLLGLVIKRRRR